MIFEGATGEEIQISEIAVQRSKAYDYKLLGVEHKQTVLDLSTGYSLLQ